MGNFVRSEARHLAREPALTVPKDPWVVVREESRGAACRAGSARGYFRFVRNWFKCVVQSEPPVALVAQLPCQPHTQVMVCSRCLYWSMT